MTTRKMKIEESNIRRWAEEFDWVRKAFKASPSCCRWCEPTRQILNILPPIVNDYYLCTFILRDDNYDKPIMIAGYYRRPRWSDFFLPLGKSCCCELIDSKRIEAHFLQMAKDIKGTSHLRANKKLAQAFLDNVYTSESDNQSSPSATKKD